MNELERTRIREGRERNETGCRHDDDMSARTGSSERDGKNPPVRFVASRSWGGGFESAGRIAGGTGR